MTAALFDEIVLPVSRGRAFFRAAVWAVPAVILGAAVTIIYGRLDFIPSGVSNRLVDYAVALATSPLLLAALWTATKCVRWLALCLWGSAVEITAAPTTLTFRLGPFGKRTYIVADLDIRYPFELFDEADEGGFESFLPEEQQRRTLLPRILHPNTGVPLQRTILQFAAGEEADIARTLRPAIDHWRSNPAPLA